MESASNKTSLFYHNIFSYPLTDEDLKKWGVGRKFIINNFQFSIKHKANFQFINGRQNIVNTRIQNEKSSKKKLIIAKEAAKTISKVPTVLFVGITGSLAMMNADKNSDIDLLIITKANTLWITRLLSYAVIWLNGYKTRKPEQKDEKDKLCLNMWLDESDLVWEEKDRNLYTAHEIAQIVPLVNRESVYERFLFLNNWILNYWPKSVRISSKQHVVSSKQKSILHSTFYILQAAFEKLSYIAQYQYMKSKISREVATPTRAIFHKNDWGKKILTTLKDID